MLLGYNTNGFAHHRLADAVDILADIGYRSLALTLEHAELDPPDARGVFAAVRRIQSTLADRKLRTTIETGSRFILDPRRKHQPTLISRDESGRRRRLDFLAAAIDIAADLGADSVSLWSGASDDDAPSSELAARLDQGLAELLAHAEKRNVRLALEPEPGMFVETMEHFARLHGAHNHPRLGLTLDLGHIHCLRDGEAQAHIRRWREMLWNIHIEDARRGVHEHLQFGDGDMDFPPIVVALRDAGYSGPLHVELSRHSHDAIASAQKAFTFLATLLGSPR